MVQLPFLTGVTRPAGLTLATLTLLDSHTRSMAPKSVLAEAVSSMRPLPEASV